MPPHYKHEENISEGRVHEVIEQRVCKPFISRMKELCRCGKISGARIRRNLPLNHEVLHKQWQPISHSHPDVSITDTNLKK
jgi:hypothetical protein